MQPLECNQDNRMKHQHRKALPPLRAVQVLGALFQGGSVKNSSALLYRFSDRVIIAVTETQKQVSCLGIASGSPLKSALPVSFKCISSTSFNHKRGKEDICSLVVKCVLSMYQVRV